MKSTNDTEGVYKGDRHTIVLDSEEYKIYLAAIREVVDDVNRLLEKIYYNKTVSDKIKITITPPKKFGDIIVGVNVQKGRYNL
jgi:hypothetical protein